MLKKHSAISLIHSKTASRDWKLELQMYMVTGLSLEIEKMVTDLTSGIYMEIRPSIFGSAFVLYSTGSYFIGP